MITAVDTSVILDILSASPKFLEASRSLFAKSCEEGRMIVCPIVWGELRPFFDSDLEMQRTLEKMHLNFDDFGPAAAARAGEFWKRYRKARGPRERLLADFLIGAHALLKADRLLTRDRGFYRIYFKELTVLEP